MYKNQDGVSDPQGEFMTSYKVFVAATAVMLSGCNKATVQYGLIDGLAAIGLKPSFNSAAMLGTTKSNEEQLRKSLEPLSCIRAGFDSGGFAGATSEQKISALLTQAESSAAEVISVFSSSYGALIPELEAKTASGDHDIVHGSPLYEKIEALGKAEPLDEPSDTYNRQINVLSAEVNKLIKDEWDADSGQFARPELLPTLDCLKVSIPKSNAELRKETADRKAKRVSIVNKIDTAEKLYEAKKAHDAFSDALSDALNRN